jgi:rhodanese-related sulfurtransferase
MAGKMIEAGFGKVYALKGGWKEWEAARYPTEPK